MWADQYRFQQEVMRQEYYNWIGHDHYRPVVNATPSFGVPTAVRHAVGTCESNLLLRLIVSVVLTSHLLLGHLAFPSLARARTFAKADSIDFAYRVRAILPASCKPSRLAISSNARG